MSDEICRAWGTLRGCRRGDHCRFIHQGKQGDAARARVAAQGAVEACRGWISERGCRYGDQCPYKHQGQGKLFVEKSEAEKAAEPCRAWKSDKGCRHGDECQYKHVGQTGKAERSPRAESRGRGRGGRGQGNVNRGARGDAPFSTDNVSKLKAQLNKARRNFKAADDKVEHLRSLGRRANPEDLQRAERSLQGHGSYVEQLERKLHAEYKRVGQSMEEKLDSLEWLNEVLDKFGFEPERTASRARQVLKNQVFINIYDLESGHFERNHATYRDFVNDINRRRKYFPLELAKEGGHLKLFLKRISYR